MGLAGSLVSVLLGVLRLTKAPPQTLLLAWDGLIVAFLFFWIIGVVSNIQRSETIDMGKMLHLPVSLRGLFLINFLASHLTLSLFSCHTCSSRWRWRPFSWSPSWDGCWENWAGCRWA